MTTRDEKIKRMLENIRDWDLDTLICYAMDSEYDRLHSLNNEELDDEYEFLHELYDNDANEAEVTND